MAAINFKTPPPLSHVELHRAALTAHNQPRLPYYLAQRRNVAKIVPKYRRGPSPSKHDLVDARLRYKLIQLSRKLSRYLAAIAKYRFQYAGK
jgi:hypothetical protein